MYAVPFIYSNSSPRCFPSSSFQGKFFLSKDNGLFSPLPPSTIVFPVKPIDYLFRSWFKLRNTTLFRSYLFRSSLPPSTIVFPVKPIDFLITHECNHFFGSLLSFAIQSQAFLFSLFCGWQGGSGLWGGLPERECKTDRHSLSIARPQGAAHEGGVLHKCFDIYMPHTKAAPYQGMLNRYFTSLEMPRRWYARMPEWSPIGGGGWGVVSWTRTLWHGDSNTPPNTTFYITCGTSLTRASPKKDV